MMCLGRRRRQSQVARARRRFNDEPRRVETDATNERTTI